MTLAHEGTDDEAMRLGLRAAEIRKELLGEDSSYALSLCFLGAISGRKQDTARALLQTRQAAVLLEKTMGEKHPYSIACLASLGRFSLQTGDYTQAETSLQRALALSTEVLGNDDSTRTYLLDSLAELYMELGDYTRAENFCWQARKLREEKISEGYSTRVQDLGVQQFAVHYEVGSGKHAEYVQGLERLAQVYQELGQFSRAEPLFREVRNFRFRNPGTSTPTTPEP